MQRFTTGGIHPGGGEISFSHGIGGMMHQGCRIKIQQVRLGALRLLPPLVKPGAGGDVLRQSGIIEVKQGVLVDHNVTPPGALLQLGGSLKFFRIAVEKLVVGAPIPGDQRLPDKHVPGRHRVNRVVGDQPVGHDRHPIERRALICHGGGPFAGPMRFGIRAF